MLLENYTLHHTNWANNFTIVNDAHCRLHYVIYVAVSFVQDIGGVAVIALNTSLVDVDYIRASSTIQTSAVPVL